VIDQFILNYVWKNQTKAS